MTIVLGLMRNADGIGIHPRHEAPHFLIRPRTIVITHQSVFNSHTVEGAKFLFLTPSLYSAGTGNREAVGAVC